MLVLTCWPVSANPPQILFGAVLRFQPHDDLVRQTLGNHRLAWLLGFLSLKSFGLGLLGSVAALPGVPFELLADGSLAESDRSRDLDLRLIVFLHPGDYLTVLRAEVAGFFRHCLF